MKEIELTEAACEVFKLRIRDLGLEVSKLQKIVTLMKEGKMITPPSGIGVTESRLTLLTNSLNANIELYEALTCKTLH